MDLRVTSVLLLLVALAVATPERYYHVQKVAKQQYPTKSHVQRESSEDSGESREGKTVGLDKMEEIRPFCQEYGPESSVAAQPDSGTQ